MSGRGRSLIIRICTGLWVSFLFAGFATTLFFATFDPSIIAEAATFPMQLDGLTGYSIGFLLFWLLLSVNSAVVAWLGNKTTE